MVGMPLTGPNSVSAPITVTLARFTDMWNVRDKQPNQISADKPIFNTGASSESALEHLRWDARRAIYYGFGTEGANVSRFRIFPSDVTCI